MISRQLLLQLPDFYLPVEKCRGGYYPPVKGRPLLQGVPLPKTIHWIVFGIHPCGALRNCGALPHTPPEAPPLDSAKGTQSLWNPIQKVL